MSEATLYFAHRKARAPKDHHSAQSQPPNMADTTREGSQGPGTVTTLVTRGAAHLGIGLRWVLAGWRRVPRTLEEAAVYKHRGTSLNRTPRI
jgi:hypothetical protein